KKPIFLLCQVLATLFCLFSISLASLPAFASARSDATSSSVLRTATHTVSVQEATTAARYWTAERMKAAKSVEVLTHDQFKQPAASLTLSPVGKPGSTTAVAPASLHRQGAPLMSGTTHQQLPMNYPCPYTRSEVAADHTQWPYRTEGSIFFTDSLKNDDTCSGIVLNRVNKRL